MTLAAATCLGLSGTGQFLGPVLGAANQLIAALALFVVGVYLVGMTKPSIYAVIPGLFVLVTTVAALLYQAYGFLLGESPNLVLRLICLSLVVLAGYASAQALPRLRQARSRSKRVT